MLLWVFILICKFNNKMGEALESIDRFFRIITSSTDHSNQRFIHEWTYLYTLLKTESVSSDRIEAYLNILENHDSNTKRNVAKAKKSLTEHPKAKDFLGLSD